MRVSVSFGVLLMHKADKKQSKKQESVSSGWLIQLVSVLVHETIICLVPIPSFSLDSQQAITEGTHAVFFLDGAVGVGHTRSEMVLGCSSLSFTHSFPFSICSLLLFLSNSSTEMQPWCLDDVLVWLRPIALHR